MDHDALRSEIETDPAGVGYAALVAAGNDTAVAGLLNADFDTHLGLVGIPDVQAELHKFVHSSGLPVWLVIEDTADDTQANAGLRAACRMVRAVATSRYENVDLSLLAVAGALDALLLGGVLTEAQREALDDLATRARSRAEVVFGAGVVVSHTDVAVALRG